MSALLKFLAALAAQLIPQILREWSRAQAEKRARAKLESDKAKVDDFVKNAGPDDQP